MYSNGNVSSGRGSANGSSDLASLVDVAHGKVNKQRLGGGRRLENGGHFAGGDFITNRHSGEFLLEQVSAITELGRRKRYYVSF